MPNAQPSLFNRPDTILGACEGLGEDFGFNAQYLRVGLAGMLFWSPVVAIAAYAAIALAVFVSRWLYPVPASMQFDAAAPVSLPAVVAAPLHGENDERFVELAAAA